jgi:hypothetical protein
MGGVHIEYKMEGLFIVNAVKYLQWKQDSLCDKILIKRAVFYGSDLPVMDLVMSDW